MKSARINFGIGAESEYVLEVDDTGVATKCFNPVTGQELGIGGGSDSVIYLGKDVIKIPSYNTLSDYLTNGAIIYYCKAYEEDGTIYLWPYYLTELKYTAPDEYLATFNCVVTNNLGAETYFATTADAEMIFD